MAETGVGLYQGKLIGKYRLGACIGEGGMGEVYLAEREDAFRQRVAVKLIRPGMASLEVVRRFLIERQTLAALNHPQIVRLIDGGTTEENLPYLVVEYVEGIPIDRYADDRKLSITDRLKLFIEVCGAVHYAHQSLIVHCDLKPSNILVTKENVPMLLDFGIAKLLDPGSLGISAVMAKTRQRAFTPDYASPEQLRGEPVTTATDVYALGVILYELLTGRGPYSSTASGALTEWIKSVCEEDAETPSTVVRRVSEVMTEEDAAPRKITPEEVSGSRESDPQKLERRLRGDLDAIALKALRKDARDRYGSVDQMAEDLRRHLSGRPVLARKNTAGYVARKFFERHKIAVVAAALVLISVAAGVATTLREARVAARRFEDVRGLAHTFLFDVHDAIQNLPGSTQVRSLIARTGTEYLDRLARDSRGDASLAEDLAEGYLKIGDVEGNPYNSNLGDTVKALENYRKALPFAEAAVAADPRNWKARRTLAMIHLEFAGVLPFHNKGLEAVSHIKEAEKLYAEVAAATGSTEAKLDLSRVWDTDGDIQGGAHGFNLGHDEEAVAAYEHSLALIPDLAPNDSWYFRAARGRAVEIAKLGDMEKKKNRMQEALAKYDEALHAAEEIARSSPNDTRAQDLLIVVLNKIAATQTSIRDSKSASETYQRVIALGDATVAADPNNDKARTGVLVAEKNLGDMYFYNLNDLPQALKSYRRSAELLELQLRGDPTNVVWQQNLAEVLTCVASCMLHTDPAEARRQAQRGLALAKSIADRPGANQEQVYNYAYLGITIEPDDLQNPKSVLPYALKAVEMSQSHDAYSLHVLSQTYAGMNDYAHAVETEEKALALMPPVEPGKPISNVQDTIQHFLEECRTELKKQHAP